VFFKPKKPRIPRITKEDVISLRDEYFLDHWPDKHYAEFMQGNAESWHLAGPQIAEEIGNEFYRCAFDIIRILSDHHSTISIIDMYSRDREALQEDRLKAFHKTKQVHWEPINHFGHMLASFYDTQQGNGRRLLPCIYGESFALLSEGAPLDVFTRFLETFWPEIFDTNAIYIYGQTYQELSSKSGAQLMRWAETASPMLRMSFTINPYLSITYDPVQIPFDRIVSTTKEVMVRQNKKVEVFER